MKISFKAGPTRSSGEGGEGSAMRPRAGVTTGREREGSVRITNGTLKKKKVHVSPSLLSAHGSGEGRD